MLDEEWVESELRHPPEIEADLKPPPVITPGGVLVLLLGLVLIAGIGLLPSEVPIPKAVLTAVVVLLAGMPLYFSWRIRQSPGPRSLALFRDHLLLPINARTTHRLAVKLAEVTGILLHEEGRRGFLLIGTGRFDFIYPLRSFRAEADARAFVDALKGRLRDALPHGDRRVDAFDAEGARTAEAMMRRPWALGGIIGALVVATLVQWWAGGFAGAFESVRFGALVRPLVLDGDWYRVGAHVLVQPAPLPFIAGQNLPSLAVVVHAVALFVLGRPLERLLGPWFVLALFTVGSLVGAAFVVTANDAAFINGPAGAAFAFIGAMVFLAVQAGERVPLGFRLSHRYWFWVLLLGGLLLFGGYTTFDYALGGVLAGAVMAAPFVSGPIPRHSLPTWTKAIGTVGPLLFVSSYALAVHRAPEIGLEAYRPVIERSSDPQRLNFFAWNVALDPNPSEDELDLAETAARRSLEFFAETPGAVAVEDTLATILYRQDEFEDAIEHQIDVVRANEDPVFASQLARFMWAGHRAGSTGTSTTTRVSLSGRMSEDGRVIVDPEVRGATGRPLTVFAIIRDADRLEGLVRLGVNPSEDTAEQRIDTPQTIPWTETTTLTVTWIGTGRTTSRAWAMVDEVREYP